MTACPGGKFRAEIGASSVSDCTDCPAGSYCPQGATEATLCPPGHYCAALATVPIQVPAGFYSPVYGLSASTPAAAGPIACPAKFYCLAGTVIPLKCPGGKYCGNSEDGTLPNSCPIGKYSGAQSIELLTDCRDCWKGHYCPAAS